MNVLIPKTTWDQSPSSSARLAPETAPCGGSLVYDPTSGSNEEDSEVLFHQFSEEVGISPSDSTKVSDYIIATKKHDVLNCEDGDLRAFIDLDMAVVGRKREDYLTYAAQVCSSVFSCLFSSVRSLPGVSDLTHTGM